MHIRKGGHGKPTSLPPVTTTANASPIHSSPCLHSLSKGFTETATLDSTSISGKMHLLEKLASLWRSDFHAKTLLAMGTSRADGMKRMHGFWWMWLPYPENKRNLLTWDMNTNVALRRELPTVPVHSDRLQMSVVVDPLQDLVVAVFLSHSALTVTDIGQDYQLFLVEFRSVSSLLPYPHSSCTPLGCKHVFDGPGRYVVRILGQPAICGDRIVILYYYVICPGQTQDLFIHVIDWRKGHANSYPLHGSEQSQFHLVDEQTIVVTGGDLNGRLTLYTLRELDGSPQHRITYLLPGLKYYDRSTYYVIHATPSFHGTAARPDLLPGYVPSLESQIMVLEVQHSARPVILVIDMVIFSEQVIDSETPIEIPWSDWGPQYTCCFPHFPGHKISVFGSKMAYALPLGRTPRPGETLDKSYNIECHVYVHIWDFNKRVIARVENIYDRNSSDFLVCRPGRLAQSPFIEDIISKHPYTAIVCRTPFEAYDLEELFLEQDRLTLTWLDPTSLNAIHIRVVCPIVGNDLASGANN